MAAISQNSWPGGMFCTRHRYSRRLWWYWQYWANRGHLQTDWTLICHKAPSGVTPIGQGWTNAKGLRALGGPKPDPKSFDGIIDKFANTKARFAKFN